MKIAIASGKGGTGKTFLSTNLSAFLSETEPVVLIDLDVEEPNTGLFIKGDLIKTENVFKPVPEWDRTNCTLCGKCQSVCNFHAVLKVKDAIMVFPELCHSCYACSELCPEGSLPMKNEKIGIINHYKYKELDHVEGKLDIGQEQAVPLIALTNDFPASHLQKVIKICDCPPGTACPAVESVKDADLVILTAEPTPFGLHDLKLMVKSLIILKKKFAVVINKWGVGNDDTLRYCENMNIPVIAKINNDRRIAEEYSTGNLVYDKFDFVRSELEKIKKYITDSGALI
ncbi:MAG TPA: ATP-binding protein [Clostridiales bacterium]|jgi:MinD superfamily P-loop ATPase|nr:ATP-binding protein [Clostridiales bacterium]HQP69123.1 ATP-binding protein [Clostridiales bacterium]